MFFKGFCKLIAELVGRVAIIIGIVVLGLYWGKLFEALLVLVAIFQFELAYRQHWFNKVCDEPVFAVYALKHNDAIHLSIMNVGSIPAYLVGVSRVICNEVPLPPEEWTKHISSPRHACLTPLSAGASMGTLAIIDRDFYNKYLSKGDCVLEISYVNRYGEWQSLMVVFHELTPIVRTYMKKPPGFLLSIVDYIILLKTFVALHKLKQKPSFQKMT